MTEMPELVAILHSLVGMAAVLVGNVDFIKYQDYIGIEKTIHSIEIYIGIFIRDGHIFWFCNCFW